MENACWQYKIKCEKRLSNNGFIPDVDFSIFEIRKINYHVADEFIKEYEWLGNIGAASHCFGLYFENLLSSVVCYSPPVSPVFLQKILGRDISKNVMQLGRGASTYWAPKWGPSKLISSSLKLMYKEESTKAVIAYADPNAGEYGTIYQACNAYYLGMTDPGGAKIYIISGKKMHPRSVYRKYGTRKKSKIIKIDPDFRTIPIAPKYRYLFVLGKKRARDQVLEKVKHLIKHYPKRPKLTSINLGT